MIKLLWTVLLTLVVDLGITEIYFDVRPAVIERVETTTRPAPANRCDHVGVHRANDERIDLNDAHHCVFIPKGQWRS